jgi:hypothetical protein
MKLSRLGCGVAAALAVGVVASAAEAHRPPPGYALEHREERSGHIIEVMVVPKEPVAGEKAEIILNLREEDSGLPYQGYVTFLVAPPAGEPGPLAIPMEFGPGQFESANIFREPGVHQLSVVFDAQGAEQRVGPIAVTVRPPSRVAGGVAITLALMTAVTYGAALRHSRRPRPPGADDG